MTHLKGNILITIHKSRSKWVACRTLRLNGSSPTVPKDFLKDSIICYYRWKSLLIIKGKLVLKLVTFSSYIDNIVQIKIFNDGISWGIYNKLEGTKDYLDLFPLRWRCNNPLFAVIYLLERSPNCRNEKQMILYLPLQKTLLIFTVSKINFKYCKLKTAYNLSHR